MKYPIPTGEVASVLSTTEPRLGETVRRGLVSPPPPVRAGRRMWDRSHILQAAEALGLLTDDLRAALGEEVSS